MTAPDMFAVSCPACHAKAGEYCRRHGQIMPGPLLACVARVRAAYAAVKP